MGKGKGKGKEGKGTLPRFILRSGYAPACMICYLMYRLMI